jgi:protein-disulfide isomerase
LLDRHLADARIADVRGTPTFFVNDRRVDGVIPAEEMLRIVEAELRARAAAGTDDAQLTPARTP